MQTLAEMMQNARVRNAEGLDVLSPQEQTRREQLEQQATSNFVQGLLCLKAIKDERLWKSTHHTWDSYCMEKFGLTESRMRQKLIAADILQEWPAVLTSEQKPQESFASDVYMNPMDTLPPPVNIEQALSIHKVEPELRLEVYETATNEANADHAIGTTIVAPSSGQIARAHKKVKADRGDIVLDTNRQMNKPQAISDPVAAFYGEPPSEIEDEPTPVVLPPSRQRAPDIRKQARVKFCFDRRRHTLTFRVSGEGEGAMPLHLFMEQAQLDAEDFVDHSPHAKTLADIASLVRQAQDGSDRDCRACVTAIGQMLDE